MHRYLNGRFFRIGIKRFILDAKISKFAYKRTQKSLTKYSVRL
jgi:hypothetical protein